MAPSARGLLIARKTGQLSISSGGRGSRSSDGLPDALPSQIAISSVGITIGMRSWIAPTKAMAAVVRMVKALGVSVSPASDRDYRSHNLARASIRSLLSRRNHGRLPPSAACHS